MGARRVRRKKKAHHVGRITAAPRMRTQCLSMVAAYSCFVRRGRAILPECSGVTLSSRKDK